MKISLSILLLFGLSIPTSKKNATDYDYQLKTIIRTFKQTIMDKGECGNQKRKVERLIYDIDEALGEDENYSDDEIREMKKSKTKAEAVEAFIGCVGDCGNYIPTIQEFDLANSLMGADIAYFSRGKYCIDIFTVKIGNYVAYLGENNSSNLFRVFYKWKSQDGTSTGKGTLGISAKSVRHLYDNRGRPSKKVIKFESINCIQKLSNQFQP